MRYVNHWHGHSQALAHCGVEYAEKQLHRLLSANRVVADQLATALLYAATLGREVEIYGQPFTHSGRADWADRIKRFTSLHVPELLDGPLRGEDARQVADPELGASHVRSPDELRQLSGWAGVRWLFRPLAVTQR
jgi:hypothetical protein